MIDEFRSAFQELIDASVATDPLNFPPALHRVYVLASQVPVEERELALHALTPILSGDHAAPGIIADLSVIAGALVEMGTEPADTGIEVLRRLRTMGKGAALFLQAWERTGGGPPPDPDQVTAQAEERVAAHLGQTAPMATMCWWTIRRHALAAKSMLGESSVRTLVHADPALHAELVAVANQLSHALSEFHQVRALLRMAEATSALILDRHSGRGFRVLFDGIGDNFQLHTLLADALIGPQGQGLDGEPPDPRWSAAFRNGEPDPQAQTVRGWWNLVAHDGSWVWNEGVPADVPTLDGEHVLVLDEQPYPRSWTARRRHPQVRGWLQVEEELSPHEAQAWWKRVCPTEPAIPGPADPPLPEPVLLAPADPPHDSGDHPDPQPPRPHAQDQDEEQDTGHGQDLDAPPPPSTEHAPTPPAQQTPAQPAHPRPEPGQAPGAALLPPLPPGVSQSSAWGPTWR